MSVRIIVGETVGLADGSLLRPLRELWAHCSPGTLPAVPLAKPSHCAASCAGFVVWPIVWHRQEGRSYGKNERRGSARNTMESLSLNSLATILHNRPIQHHRHMGNNTIDIWVTTVSTYGQQQKRNMTNNTIVICATTISAYHKQRQRDITNNGAGICALPHIKNGNHYY